jgi:hypothetical protein
MPEVSRLFSPVTFPWFLALTKLRKTLMFPFSQILFFLIQHFLMFSIGKGFCAHFETCKKLKNALLYTQYLHHLAAKKIIIASRSIVLVPHILCKIVLISVVILGMLLNYLCLSSLMAVKILK